MLGPRSYVKAIPKQGNIGPESYLYELLFF